MPSIAHEGFLQPFQDRPDLAARLLVNTLGVTLPEWKRARLRPADLTDLIPTEFRADAVIELYSADAPSLSDPEGDAGKPVHAVVLEVQWSDDDGKPYSWPAYLTNLRAKLKCPTTLLVISPKPSIAKWSAKPIEIGHPGFVLKPIVLGPNQIPVVSDPQEAERTPELAVLSTLAHGATHPKHRDILEAFTGVLGIFEEQRADDYIDIVTAVLPEAALRYLERLMLTKADRFKSEYSLRHIRRGEAKARAQDVLTVLSSRSIDVPEEARNRITACADLDQLDAWIHRAGTADSIDELFAPTESAASGAEIS